MKHEKKRLRYFFLSLLLLGALSASLVGCASPPAGGDRLGDGTYLLTVDGYGVTEEEFRLFLADQKAVTANYFWTQYQVQPDADFWTTEVNGETPLSYAKQRALDALVKSKVEFILAAERGVLEYKDYDGLMDDMEAENAERAEKLETGEVFYGVTKFTPFTYYQYLNNNLRAELEYAQRDLTKPSEDDLRRVYEENREGFSRGVVYEYDVTYADGASEHISQNDHEIGKEDYTTEDLLFRFASMTEGETLWGYDYHGVTADITYRGMAHQGYVPFEEAEESLKALYARQELTELIQARAAGAKVELDQARFDAIEME